MANIPKIQKALYPHIPKIDQVSHIPLDIYKNILYPFMFFGQYPCIPKTFPRPQD